MDLVRWFGRGDDEDGDGREGDELKEIATEFLCCVCLSLVSGFLRNPLDRIRLQWNGARPEQR